MDYVEMNVMDSKKGVCVSGGNSTSTEVSDVFDIFGEPEILPRVGSEYQVELPSLITVHEYLRLSNSFAEAEINLEEQEALKGVDVNNKNELLQSECVDITSKLKLELLDVTSLKLGESEDFFSKKLEAGFLLGLYIFGKNLVVVKRFIESKQMGEMLSYYYGRFYGSKRYRRWSECRKIKSRRSIFGQRIFTGLRHQELLSRLLPHVSEECQITVQQISKTYGEGKISLEQYVLTLKATFGLPALVEAVGVEKGSKISQESSWILLKPINMLLKARSSDLFWEAVWPRLLDRGWHSEEPYNHGFPTGSRNSLVFLIPGIKKFSRRKLVKGDHYFDSVSDVLRKVASNPELIEIECDRSKEENGWTDETKGANVTKFTVVDTSLSNGKSCSVREVRCLPGESMNSHTSSLSDSEEEDDGEIHDDEFDDKYSSSDTFGLNKDETNDLRATITNSYIHPFVPVAKRRRRSPPRRKEATSLSTANSRVDLTFQQEAKSSEHPLEKPPFRALFDLNIPFSQDAETDIFMTDYKTNEVDKPQAVKSPECGTNSEQETKTQNRREKQRIMHLVGELEVAENPKRARTCSVTPSDSESLNSFTVDFTVNQNGNAIKNSNTVAAAAAEVFNNPGNAMKNSNAAASE
ncbi:hypothetical protein F8388_012969, partial [Cannabis sativa]